MEVNKENKNQVVPKSKIPIPLQPLPALSKHLLNDVNLTFENTRRPLKTINSQFIPSQRSHSKFFDSAVPGNSRVPNKPKSPITLDTRHVTVRNKDHDSNWNYNIFNDEKTNSIITISDDEIDVEDSGPNYFFENRTKNCLGEARAAVTPVAKCSTLEANGIRNIKRSLKRPHSRELQGLSPVPKQEIKIEEKVKRRLNFSDRLQDNLQSPDYLKKCYMTCLTRDYTTDMFIYLLSSESKPLNIPRTCSITRACIINWLVKVNGPDGNPATIQAACWYLDSILGTRHVQLDKLQLVAAACYWIAQKLHGPVISSSKLVKCANYAFTPGRLMTTEKLVLEKLKFPTQPVVPQEYITYLSWWCDNDHPGEIEVAATFLCLTGLLVDKVLCGEYPSVIAAASVRNALVLLKKHDLIVQLIRCPVYKLAEKKASKMTYVRSVMRRSVRTIGDPIYDYKAPFENYNVPPKYIARKIVEAARDFVVIDTRVIKGETIN